MSVYGPFTPTPNPGYPTLSFPVGFEEAFVDTTTMLATLTNLLVTLPMSSEKWIESPAHTFTSPADSAGRFLKLVFTNPSSTQLNLDVRDQNNVAVITSSQRSIVMTPGNTIHYYSCSKFLYIQDETTSFHLGGGMLTSFPEAEGGNGNYVYAHGTSNSAGSNDGQDPYLSFYYMLDNGVATVNGRLIDTAINSSGNNFGMQMGTGAYKYDAPEMQANYSGSNRFAGRMFNAYVCDSSFAPGATRTLPIGNSGETGVFRVVNTSVQPGTFYKIMLRIA
jgi:hypothetical protein